MKKGSVKKTKKPAGNKIRNDSKDWRYFVIAPRLVWALSRNPFDYTLWCVVKDVAGDSGECYLSTPELADLAMMSTGQVSKSRSYWISIGILAGELKRDKGYPQAVWHLTVPDIWAQNIAWAQKYVSISERIEFKKSLHPVKASHSEGKRSPGESKASPHEGKASPGETKNIPKRKTSKKKIKRTSSPPSPPLGDGEGDPVFSENQTAIKLYIEKLEMIFPPDLYGHLEMKDMFLECDSNTVLGWITKAYQDRESLTRGGGPLGLIISRLKSFEPVDPFYIREHFKILPSEYLEAVGLVEFQCEHCDFTAANRSDMQSHKRDVHPFVCMECGKLCDSREDEQQHYNERHNTYKQWADTPRDEIIPLPIPGPDGLTGEQAWQQVKGQLQMEMPRASFDTWVRDTEVESLTDGIMTVKTRNAYACDWLTSRLTTTVEKLLSSTFQEGLKVNFISISTIN